jgi:hypothetical protein
MVQYITGIGKMQAKPESTTETRRKLSQSQNLNTHGTPGQATATEKLRRTRKNGMENLDSKGRQTNSLRHGKKLS